jgi:hypothetical protein
MTRRTLLLRKYAMVLAAYTCLTIKEVSWCSLPIAWPVIFPPISSMSNSLSD